MHLHPRDSRLEQHKCKWTWTTYSRYLERNSARRCDAAELNYGRYKSLTRESEKCGYMK